MAVGKAERIENFCNFAAQNGKTAGYPSRVIKYVANYEDKN